MPARLAPMRLIFCPIFERKDRAERHVQPRQVLRLVTIDAFDREDAMPVSAAPQAEGGVRAAILALQRRVARRMTIDAARMHKDLVRFHKGLSRPRVVAQWRRAAERAAGDRQRRKAQERAEQSQFDSSHRKFQFCCARRYELSRINRKVVNFGSTFCHYVVKYFAQTFVGHVRFLKIADVINILFLGACDYGRYTTTYREDERAVVRIVRRLLPRHQRDCSRFAQLTNIYNNGVAWDGECRRSLIFCLIVLN